MQLQSDCDSVAAIKKNIYIFQNLRVILHPDDYCIITGRQKATLKKLSLEHCRDYVVEVNQTIMVNDKKGGNHKLLNSFNGVHVFVLQGCDPGYKNCNFFPDIQKHSLFTNCCTTTIIIQKIKN